VPASVAEAAALLHLPSELVQFQASLTNTSDRSVWYWAQSPEFPFFSKVVRRDSEPVGGEGPAAICGHGASLHELAPGASLKFSASTSPTDVGSWLSLVVNVYPDAGGKQAIRVRSSEARIQ
jgi:hypothetical protein